MKKILFLTSMALTLALVSCRTTTQPISGVVPKPVALSPLRVEGNRIVNAAGDEVRLRGVNAGCWLLIEPWMLLMANHAGVTSEKDIWDILDGRFGREKKLELIRTYRENFFTEQDVQHIARLGLNCLRVPIWWRAVSDPEYGGDMTYLDRVISWCADNGVYVIVDLHGAPGGQNEQAAIIGEPMAADLWKQEIFKEQSVAWWEEIAKRYKGNPSIAGFDLLNEAMAAPLDDLIDLYDRMYKAVRAIDPGRVLFIEDGLLGFHKLPRPADMGWENVVYSIHYYPQTTEEGIFAPDRDFHRMNRSSIWFGVPTYMGEFNTMQIERGGASSFLRFVEVFDYFGWSWSFWSFKKIEDNVNSIWGVTGYVPEAPAINLHEDSFESIKNAFASFRTGNLGGNPLLETVLRQPVRWKREPAEPGVIRLGLETAYLFPEKGDIRYEWGRAAPNIGYWGPGERVAWPVEIAEGGRYVFGIRFANNREDAVARIWLDGVSASDAQLPNSGGWEKYADASLAVLELTPGRHVIEISQADDGDGFMNLQGGRLKKTDQPAAALSADIVLLNPLNAEPLRKGTPLRVEWWNNPPNIGHWESGEEVAWSLRTPTGGTYRLFVSYSTPTPDTELVVLLNGKAAWSGSLASTGAWHEFQEKELGAAITLEPGTHRLSLQWITSVSGGAGNFRGARLVRAE